MPDIESRNDIKLLVDTFYKHILKDDLIGHFFTQVVKLDFERHMPVMYDFWETTLLGRMKYKGNPMLKHIALNEKEAILPEHFERWLSTWERIIRENFHGPKADEAIQKAGQIAMLMKYKMEQGH